MNDRRSTIDAGELPPPVTGIARGNEGTGTALDDTQLLNVAEWAPLPAKSVPAATAAPDIEQAPVAAHDVPVQAVAAQPLADRPAPSPASQPRPRRKAERRTPAARVVGFALAAGLAVFIGAALAAGPPGDGAALGQGSPDVTAAPEVTPEAKYNDGKGGKGNGKGNGNDEHDDD